MGIVQTSQLSKTNQSSPTLMLTRRGVRILPLQITADPYFHVRNASEHGALNVIKVMFKHRDDLRVQGVGLQRMAGSLLEGNTSHRVLLIALTGTSS